MDDYREHAILEEKRNEARRIAKLNTVPNRVAATKVGPVFNPANPSFAVAKWAGWIFDVDVAAVSANEFFDSSSLGQDVYLTENKRNPANAIVGHEFTKTFLDVRTRPKRRQCTFDAILAHRSSRSRS